MKVFVLKVEDTSFISSTIIEEVFNTLKMAKARLEEYMETHVDNGWRFSLTSGDINVSRFNMMRAMNGEYTLFNVRTILRRVKRDRVLGYLTHTK